MQCPSCLFANPDGMRFCGKCGAPLAAAEPRPEMRSSPDAERRHLSVLFCDLVGSTALSERLDPEELRDIIRAYQDTCAGPVSRFGGYVAQYLGDGILVYFGFPKAHEDAAQRSVRASLGILDAIEELNQRLEQKNGLRVAVRLGIHTGLVVVGELGQGAQQEQLALGQTPNVAARLESLAEPDTVVISEATYRLVQGFFHCELLGNQSLKGMSRPMKVYRVLRESSAPSRFAAAARGSLPPLVGRRDELTRLRNAWREVAAGDGGLRSVLVRGEAGMGKSRLVEAFKERLEGIPHARIELHCSPYFQMSALYPVIELLERTARITPRDTKERKRRRLDALLRRTGFEDATSRRLFALLLSIPEQDEEPGMSPQERRRETLEHLVRWLLAQAAERPLILLVEDLQWIDPSTFELLRLVQRHARDVPVLLLLTSRPELDDAWPEAADDVQKIDLPRLTAAESSSMVGQLVATMAGPQSGSATTIDPDALAELVRKSDGVPLFVEELSRVVQDAELLRHRGGRLELTSPLDAVVPERLQDLLTERLDRLGEIKRTAQLAAVFGREFDQGLLAAVSDRTDGDVTEDLERLISRGILLRSGTPPTASYRFRHVLIQEEAYASLLKSQRRKYHRRIARTLEKRSAETAARRPELLAHHHTEAENLAEAIEYWRRAGQQALERWANLEASRHLGRGLELVRRLPPGHDRDHLELDLLTHLGPSLMAVKGFAANEVEEVYTRASELGRKLGDPSKTFPALWGLSRLYHAQSRLDRALELGEHLVDLARQVGDVGQQLEAHRMMGSTLYHQGRFADARKHLERGISLFDPADQRSDVLYLSPQVHCLFWMGYVEWHLGRPETAIEKSRAALRLAVALGDPFGEAVARTANALLHQYRREPEDVLEQAEAAIALAEEHRFPVWLEMGTILRGWAYVALGRVDEGLAEMRRGLTAWQALGMALATQIFHLLMAEGCLTAERLDEALEHLALARQRLEAGERAFEAELYRLEGEIRRYRPADGTPNDLSLDKAHDKAHDGATPEDCFRRALDVARRQGARSLELRAATSLARLDRGSRAPDDAESLLRTVVESFDEGADTADLAEARELLGLTPP